jgi:large subunit ribosomal protein L18e
MISKTTIAKRLERKENPFLKGMIILLKKQNKPFWLKIADMLSRPGNYSINLDKLDHLTKEKETVIVPGKLLATGSLNHSLKIAAFSASESAKQKLKLSKSQFLTIKELLKQNPKGADVRILI